LRICKSDIPFSFIEHQTMTIKDLLAKIPYSADLYDAIRPARPNTRYNLSQLEHS